MGESSTAPVKYPVIFKFRNGAEMEQAFQAPICPDICKVKFRIVGDSRELVCFWFELADKLPSGTMLFKETTEEKAFKIWSGQ